MWPAFRIWNEGQISDSVYWQRIKNYLIKNWESTFWQFDIALLFIGNQTCNIVSVYEKLLQSLKYQGGGGELWQNISFTLLIKLLL